jgi:hypothetical protein
VLGAASPVQRRPAAIAAVHELSPRRTPGVPGGATSQTPRRTAPERRAEALPTVQRAEEAGGDRGGDRSACAP